jgi:S-DNA-T family DNA segregation ATPase FtsK/SpoIIIE
MRIQVAAVVAPQPRAARLRAVTVDLRETPVAVVSASPELFASAARGLAPDRQFVILAPPGAGGSTEQLEVSRGGVPPVLIADPDLWQSHWALFTRLQRGSVLFDGCSTADIRVLTRSRELPPPFPAGARTLWLRAADGRLDRATVVPARPEDA